MCVRIVLMMMVDGKKERGVWKRVNSKVEQKIIGRGIVCFILLIEMMI